MKKSFIWDPVMRSSALKYDPCIVPEGRSCKILCEDCKITLIADRFLGEEFQKEILGRMGNSRGRYPYVIIADGLGCNLRCWFCYAYKFFDKKSAEENNCSLAYITPDRLAEQFGCKLKKLSDFDSLIKSAQDKNISDEDKETAIKHLEMRLPLMRIRISGGEPIFSTKDTVIDPANPNLIKSTIEYWLLFFERLDKIIEKLKASGRLNIIDKSTVKDKDWVANLPFPTCLADRAGRLNIRFDTNGILFGNQGITEMFIGGLFKLFKENKLNNLFVEIDYSFKGPTPEEYSWSQRKDLPVDSLKIDFNYELEKHPQFTGYSNIVEKIKEYCLQDKGFYNCAGITVERGINHHFRYKTYINCKESLNWDKFTQKTGIKFSIVDNPIEMFNWRNWRPKPCFIHNGANIKIIASGETFDLKDNPNIEEFDSFRKKHHSDCYFVMFPIEKEIVLEKKLGAGKIRLFPSERVVIEATPVGWLCSGDEDNWQIAIRNKKWGVKEKYRILWEKIRLGDYVLFYVTRPVSRIVGLARVKILIEENSLLWPDEVQENNVKYPLRIQFDEIVVFPKEDWGKGVKPYGLVIRHGINPIYEQEKLDKLIKTLNSSMN